LVVFVDSLSELPDVEPTRTRYWLAPFTPFQVSVTNPLFTATARFVGTLDEFDGCDVFVELEEDDEGPVGDDPALSAPPQAIVIVAATTTHNTPARFIPALLERISLSADRRTRRTMKLVGAMRMPRSTRGAVRRSGATNPSTPT
jgi:hypothetical protein